MHDLAEVAVYYGAALIALCTLIAIGEGVLERRDRRQTRQWKRDMRPAPERDDVLHAEIESALSLVTKALASDEVQGPAVVQLVAAAAALRRAGGLPHSGVPFEQPGQLVSFPGYSVKVV